MNGDTTNFKIYQYVGLSFAQGHKDLLGLLSTGP